MGACLSLASSVVAGTFALAGLSAILLTVLLLAAASHPVLAIVLILMVAGALARGSRYAPGLSRA